MTEELIRYHFHELDTQSFPLRYLLLRQTALQSQPFTSTAPESDPSVRRQRVTGFQDPPGPQAQARSGS